MEARLDIPPVSIAAVRALVEELGVSFVVAQVLARRGLGEPQAARAFLAADDDHDPSAFADIERAVARILDHVRARQPIVVHGDYDVDGVCSTAILVRVLRSLGAEVEAYLPSRQDDGYGLSAATVDRLAARGTRLLITTDCAITAVDEVALAQASGLEVVVTDHHQLRADGRLPDAPIVHPALCGYPCPDLCATAVAYKLAAALLQAAGRDATEADHDLDLVALATVADCVPLVGENRALVRRGLAALAQTQRPGLRALMRVAQADPGALDARTIGFRLAPRINAAGRLYRADAGLELLLTDDPDRAASIAAELDQANAERRHVETRILFAAEAQIAELGEQPAYVLASDDWHAGVIGIVASRIAERHHRPCVLIALDGDQGTGSGRSIPAFDLLAGLDASAAQLLRHGGHRAAAGCTVTRAQIDAFRAAFVEHAAATLTPDDLVRRARVDAVVAGDELGYALAQELEQLGPFGSANPEVALLVPAARLSDPRPMGEGKHVRFSVEAGGHRARGVAFGTSRLPEADVVDAVFGLELNEWGGAVEPRLVLRCAQAPVPEPITLVGEPDDDRAAALAELTAPLEPGPATWPPDLARARDRRGGGAAGVIVALQASGEAVLVVCADARRRRRHLATRLGGVALCSWLALERDPALRDRYAHLVALDPPTSAAQAGLVDARFHLAWGKSETAFALRVLEADHDLRGAAVVAYRALRDYGLEAAIHAAASPLATGRALRALAELGLVDLQRGVVTGAVRRDLEQSPTYRACQARLDEGRVRLAAAPRAVQAA